MKNIHIKDLNIITKSKYQLFA